MSGRNQVVARRVTRWYVNGHGYSSEISAYMQIARYWVRRVCREAMQAKGAQWSIESEREWYAKRYPARPECNCNFCARVRYGTRQPMPALFGRGCWFARMEDYRKIGREILTGGRHSDGRPILALPEFVEQATGQALRPYQRQVIENLSNGERQ